MEQNPNVQRLRALELERIEVLKKHYGTNDEAALDAEEDPILDEMDDAWWAMTEEEREYCRKPGPNHEETHKWLT